jgi:putative endonuclease
MSAHLETGRLGEAMAVQFIEKQGYIVLDVNYRFGPNEIDIVALDHQELVFIEVKTRHVPLKEFQEVYPEYAVSKQKQKACFRVADAYIYERRMVTVPVRFDVIAIRLMQDGSNEISHYKDAFRDDTTLQTDIDVL